MVGNDRSGGAPFDRERVQELAVGLEEARVPHELRPDGAHSPVDTPVASLDARRDEVRFVRKFPVVRVRLREEGEVPEVVPLAVCGVRPPLVPA